VNHGVRASALQDECVVLALGARLDRPVRIAYVTAGDDEAALRNARYAALETIARECGAAAIATAHWLSKGQTANLANVSKWAFLLTFAGVGITTDIRQIARAGWRPLVVAIIGLAVVASVSLGLVLLTSRVFHWGLGS